MRVAGLEGLGLADHFSGKPLAERTPATWPGPMAQQTRQAKAAEKRKVHPSDSLSLSLALFWQGRGDQSSAM